MSPYEDENVSGMVTDRRRGLRRQRHRRRHLRGRRRGRRRRGRRRRRGASRGTRARARPVRTSSRSIVRDNAGNAARSDIVPVVVGTYVPPPPPPPVNHNPVAVGDSLTSVGRVPVTFTAASLLANDSDPDGQAIAVRAVGVDFVREAARLRISAAARTATRRPRPSPASTRSATRSPTVASGTASGRRERDGHRLRRHHRRAGSGLVAAFGFEEASGTAAVNSSNAAFNGAHPPAAACRGQDRPRVYRSTASTTG